MSNFTSYEIICGILRSIFRCDLLSWNIVLIGVEPVVPSRLHLPNSPIRAKGTCHYATRFAGAVFIKSNRQGLSVPDDEALDVLGRDELGCCRVVFMLEQQTPSQNVPMTTNLY